MHDQCQHAPVWGPLWLGCHARLKMHSATYLPVLFYLIWDSSLSHCLFRSLTPWAHRHTPCLALFDFRMVGRWLTESKKTNDPQCVLFRRLYVCILKVAVWCLFPPSEKQTCLCIVYNLFWGALFLPLKWCLSMLQEHCTHTHTLTHMQKKKKKEIRTVICKDDVNSICHKLIASLFLAFLR